jgi:hypothetical protein
MTRFFCTYSVALAAALVLATGPAKADFIKAGRLTCVISKPDAALHFGSARPMRCTLRQRHRPRVQRYRGTVRKYGIEAGVFSRTVMRWDVYSHTGRVRRGGLAGSYGGITFEGALGGGVGGNIVDGGPDGIALSPVGTQVQTGSVNITTGVIRFSLRYRR